MTTGEALDALRKLRARIDADVTEIPATWVHDYHTILDSASEWFWFGLALRIPQSEIHPSGEKCHGPATSDGMVCKTSTFMRRLNGAIAFLDSNGNTVT